MDAEDDPAARPSVDWEAVRADYEAGGGTLDSIAAKYGVTRSAVSWRVKTLFWSKRYRGRGLGRPQIIDRMFRLLERQIIQLEQDMTETGDKEVAVLGKLATTLEKLIEIDRTANPPKSPAQHKDMEQLREKLAQRLAQLRRT